ncbi:uncharacterized protein TRIREDRAFT_112629 [Trichoderma reesei QM6a]|uniref:Predicted protein n=1 Tax=Hypocrea jecorina (strain QM6a) TaxID=431241 RepID=G0RXJ7_HYPJQ|nr:uncharacterized protein TRIREDRAFT_112629 [Trichoderma reesei QM6a]EGR44095.1 predicted protein [Trichoderma reesei QM6a]
MGAQPTRAQMHLPDDGANSLYQNAEPEEEKRQCNAFVSPQRHAMQQAETKNLECPKVGVPNGSTRSLFSSKQSLGAEGGRSIKHYTLYLINITIILFKL